MKNEKLTVFLELAQKSALSGGLRSVVFHSPASGDFLKEKGTLKRIGGDTVLQMERFLTEGRVAQENVALERVADALEDRFETFRRGDLTDGGGTASVMISALHGITVSTPAPATIWITTKNCSKANTMWR